MKNKTVEILISSLKAFKCPKIHLEQYITPPKIATQFLQLIDASENIENKKIIDLCAGTGFLGIGALLYSPLEVSFVECDEDAVNILKENLELCEYNFYEYVIKNDFMWNQNGKNFDFNTGFKRDIEVKEAKVNYKEKQIYDLDDLISSLKNNTIAQNFEASEALQREFDDCDYPQICVLKDKNDQKTRKCISLQHNKIDKSEREIDIAKCVNLDNFDAENNNEYPKNTKISTENQNYNKKKHSISSEKNNSILDIEYGKIEPILSSTETAEESTGLEYQQPIIRVIQSLYLQLSTIPEKYFDIVLLNPPFGTKEENADINALDFALSIGKTVFSMHKSSTRQFITKRYKNCDLIASLKYPLEKTYRHHKAKKVYVDVDFYRFY
ncbi:hypothetical protein EDEG_02093 [Edhazardia aedis USNM 41457]|uniref:Methyltransferase small domain-containing protein n=1 Tax=Edhazardia aedis (strain USNM 41457) TaxID=1003232 RepID=J9D736_EDHAE|nr:hypothetical protein EDEG_02093 [Edhazardia aedis USNM 41457]|eukprot:EJW03581.1 hypothetical protein EDEG_02093 [Edhazardia aedis USNM 41457]